MKSVGLICLKLDESNRDNVASGKFPATDFGLERLASFRFWDGKNRTFQLRENLKFWSYSQTIFQHLSEVVTINSWTTPKFSRGIVFLMQSKYKVLWSNLTSNINRLNIFFVVLMRFREDKWWYYFKFLITFHQVEKLLW